MHWLRARGRLPRGAGLPATIVVAAGLAACGGEDVDGLVTRGAGSVQATGGAYTTVLPDGWEDATDESEKPDSPEEECIRLPCEPVIQGRYAIGYRGVPWAAIEVYHWVGLPIHSGPGVPLALARRDARLNGGTALTRTHCRQVDGRRACGFGWRTVREEEPLRGRAIIVRHHSSTFRIMYVSSERSHPEHLRDLDSILAAWKWR